MADRKRGLGRGFDSLIPTAVSGAGLSATAVADDADGRQSPGEAIHELSPVLVDPNPYQPRQDFNQEELEALAASIRVHGILQPLVVTKTGSRYQLIAGERIERPERLVHQHHRGVGRQTTGHPDALLLPAGEVGNMAVCKVDNVKGFQCVLHDLTIAFSEWCKRREVRKARHRDNVADGGRKAEIDRFNLRNVGNGTRFCGGRQLAQ